MTPVRHEEDVEIMASILQQNGYPAGSKELQFEEAQKSKCRSGITASNVGTEVEGVAVTV
jgi:hypothetical protein